MNVTLVVGENLKDDQILWRYMDLAKFLSLLKQNAIWLARVDTFRDKHEGRFPNEMKNIIEKAYTEFGDDDLSPVRDADDFQDYLVKNTFVSCWHENSSENMVMWEIYGRDNNAVAIQTTVKNIKNNINTSGLIGHSLNLKDINYKNADEVQGVLRYEDCFFIKRRHFSFEQEVRISLDTYLRHNPTKKTPYGHKLPINTKDLSIKS